MPIIDETISPVSTEPLEQETPKRKRRKKRQPIYLQPEEVERFFRVIDSPRDRALFRLMYSVVACWRACSRARVWVVSVSWSAARSQSVIGLGTTSSPRAAVRSLVSRSSRV
jgi:hypothetical protein